MAKPLKPSYRLGRGPPVGGSQSDRCTKTYNIVYMEPYCAHSRPYLLHGPSTHYSTGRYSATDNSNKTSTNRAHTTTQKAKKRHTQTRTETYGPTQHTASNEGHIKRAASTHKRIPSTKRHEAGVGASSSQYRRGLFPRGRFSNPGQRARRRRAVDEAQTVVRLFVLR